MMGDYQTAERMAAKLEAIPLPDLKGKTVLDLGCDHGYWSHLASNRGASRVLGVDHGRIVRDEGWVDLVERCRQRQIPRCEFMQAEIGSFPDLGQWDVVLFLAVYHHVYAGDHDAIWRWLRRCVADGGVLLWDGPWDTQDSVVASTIKDGNYTKDKILEAARRHFDVEVIGPAQYRPHRYILRCT